MRPLTVETIIVGAEAVIDSCPANTENAVVFEDDRATGYFYALTRYSSSEMRILDAVHIYNVDNVIYR